MHTVVWDDDDRKGDCETRCRLIAYSSRKAPTSPSDGRIAINSTICFLNIHTVVWDDDERNGEGETRCRRTNRYQQYWNLMMYNLAIRKCTSPPLLAPRLKIFKLKFTTPPGIEPRTC